MTTMSLWIERVIRGELKGTLPFLYRTLMLPIAYLFRLVVTLRHVLYDATLLKAFEPPLPTISIGNISVGGTGKTELVSYITTCCLPFARVAILSRGSGRTSKNKKPFLVDPCKHSFHECGDEPWLLARRHPEALVIVCRDRYEGARYAHTLGAQLILLDDGMQHRRLARHFEIVILKHFEKKEAFLPSGTLRDLPQRLKNAHLVFIEGVTIGDVKKWVEAPVINFKRNVKGVYKLLTNEELSLEGKRVALFSAIANPERFVKTVHELGAEICTTLHVIDHGFLDENQMEAFMQEALSKGAQWIVCTEKDRMKIPCRLSSSYPVAFVKQQLILSENKAAFEEAIEKIKTWTAKL